MTDHIYLIGGIVLGIIGFVVVFTFHRRQAASGDRSWLSYLLLWPLVLDRDKSKRDGKLLTKRELLGWAVVIAVAILAIIFTPSKFGG